MKPDDLAKLGFAASLIFCIYLTGFLTHELDVFPSSHLRRAIHQGHALISPPPFVLPAVHDREGAHVEDPERMQQGVTLIGTNWRDFEWRPGLRLVDRKGDVLHQWAADPHVLFPDAGAFRPPWAGGLVRTGNILHGAVLLPDGDVLLNIDYLGTVRMDACGRIEWRLRENSHHSIAPADDGSYWISAGRYQETSTENESGPPLIRREGPVFRDQILNVASDGTVLRRIDILELLRGSGLERLIFRAAQHRSLDPTHLNDVEPLPDSLAAEYPGFSTGDLLISLRDLNVVLVIDPETLRVLWHATEPFIDQHDPDFIGDGWIGIFDNNTDGTQRGTILGGSRIVAIQPHTDSISVLFNSRPQARFYTERQGKWQLLSNGNLLLAESYAGRILEVDPSGQTVWEWIHEPYDEGLVAEVPEGNRYEIGVDEVAQWPCSTIDLPRRH